MTGLIYVILIALWGVVLVPRLLRYHDEGRERRASERLQTALSSLRPAGQSEPGSAGGSLESAASWSEYASSLMQRGIGPHSLTFRGAEGISRAARRRRKIVVSLGLGFAVSLVGAVAGVLPGSFVVLVGMALGSYVAAMAYVMGRGVSGVRPPRDQGAEVADISLRRGAGAGVQQSSVVTDGVRLISGEEDREGTWDARQTTLPTYVTKPRASKIPRRIDLTARGWTGADMVERARQQRPSRELEEQFGMEWAAVEPNDMAELEELASPSDHGDEYYRKAVNE
ncbi:MAG: hypothetical protein U0990_05800 [Candidatus Nanopelagicales bacterium]|nr:hypothetical protein [Candidatus Nanopelagicales bacterium]MDZ4249587.1 hypothetical protein [Candidatus Nanopelagicales bacterium]